MSIATELAARYNSQQLIELTNSRDPSQTTVNTAVRDQACTSAQTWFETYTEEAYDSTVGIHVELVVEGVIALLQKWGGSSPTVGAVSWSAWKDDCRDMKSTRSRARITPTTNSELTPSDENPSGGTVRPWSDDREWSGLVPQRGGRDDVNPDVG